MHASVVLWKIVSSGQRIQHENCFILSVYWLTCLRNTTYKVFARRFNWNSEQLFWCLGGWSGIIWILIFMIPVVFAQWFMIPTRVIFQIHDSRRLLITYWLISGSLVSFCVVSLLFKLLLHPYLDKTIDDTESGWSRSLNSKETIQNETKLPLISQ